jgi:WD40 repeat protein
MLGLSPRRIRRRGAALVFTALAGTLALPAGAGAAVSLPAAPDRTAVPDGRVNAIVRVGGTIYLGGSFTSVRKLDGTVVTRDRLAALDAATGDVTSWNPNANSTVMALAANGDGTRIFAGGDFTMVGGKSRARLAKIDAASGSVSSWNPGASSTVRAMLVKDSRLYIGGTFSTVKGVTVNRLAAVSTSDGSVKTDFKPRPDAGVRSLALAPDGSKLYVGGSFTTIGGASRRYLGAVSPSSGSARTWAPNPDWFVYGVAVSSDGTRVFAGGAGEGGRVAAWSSSGTRKWEVTLDGDANAVVLTANAVYAGGHFHTAAGQSREKLAAFDRTTGALDAWNPGADSLAGIYAVHAASDRLAVGGDFTVIGGAEQPRYAQFSGTP